MATKEQILRDMLADVDARYDKQVGSFIYDALAPVAGQFEKTDQSLEAAKDRISLDNLHGEELAQRVKERTGIDRHQATHAIGSVIVAGNGTINVGDLFETESGVQFRATETKGIVGSDSINIEAVTSGPSGNVPADTITLFPVTLEGITSVTNPEPTFDGFEAESDEALLQRYYERIRTPATSGNKAHYKNWAKEVAGVGDARVMPLWNGDNTVKVIIIDSDRLPASPELVESVQNYIDPDITGLGEGVAPIGAFCTVVSAEALELDITFTAIKDPAYTDGQIQANVEANIIEHLKSIAFIEDYVSYAQIGAIILRTAGILDYSNLKINDITTNITITDHQVAILGGVMID